MCLILCKNSEKVISDFFKFCFDYNLRLSMSLVLLSITNTVSVEKVFRSMYSAVLMVAPTVQQK